MEVTITIRGGAELLSSFGTLLPLVREPETAPAPAPVTPSDPVRKSPTKSDKPETTPATVTPSDPVRKNPTKSDKPGPAPAPWEVPAPASSSETSFAELVKLSNRISEARGMAWIGEYLSSKGVKTLRGLPPKDYPAIKLEFETILKDSLPQKS
ncbi:MAG: hypothetical protein SOW44_07595 [Porphyromonas sp.]|nr:hypothetical protein [Bacteroidales bacterium]MDY3101184.1 hypothetical protein [Porphyromonas sp.]